MKKIVFAIVDLIILVVVGVFLYEKLARVTIDFKDLNYSLLFLSVGISLIVLLSLALINFKINQLFDIPLDLRCSLEIFFGSLLASYIPGRIFVLFKRKMLADKHGVGMMNLMSVYFVETITYLLASILFFGAMTIASCAIIPDRVYAAIILFIFASILSLHPRLFNLLYARYQRWKGCKEIRKFSLSYKSIWLMVLAHFATWFIQGAGIVLFLRSVVLISPADYLYLCGIVAIAGVVGIMAFIMPCGLGIREGVIVVGFSAIMNVPQAAFCAVCLRIWTTVSDILGVYAFKLFQFLENRGENKK